MTMDPFFTVHQGLPREGPGLPEDVEWALEVAQTPEEARICDAACGPGADTVVLAHARPKARIDACELHQSFVDAARAATRELGDRVQVDFRDYREISGPYDLIWCAGAAYFVGYPELLDIWRPQLAPDGAVAFSEPVWLGDDRSPEARAFWEEYPGIEDLSSIVARLDDRGWQILSQRTVIGAAWEAYYTPMTDRIAELRTGAVDAALEAAIAEAEREISLWRAAPDEIAYELFVVCPK